MSGCQRKEKHGVVSEIVMVDTELYGKLPLRVYSNMNKTDCQLAKQAKKNHQGQLKRKKEIKINHTKHL